MFDQLAKALADTGSKMPGRKAPRNRASARLAARNAGPHRPGWNHRRMKAFRPMCVACRSDKSLPYGQLCPACREHAELVRAGRALKVQAEAEKFRCTAPGCGRPFGSRQALAAHSRAHSTEVHVCGVCSREFGTAQALSAHGRAHKVGASA